MKKEIPIVKIIDGELSIEGDFKFEMSPTMVNEESTAFKKISFNWCVEAPTLVPEDVILEVLGEKLKQDFIKQAKER